MENEQIKPQGAEWDDTVPKDTWRNYSASGRLAALLAGVTFGALFFPFMGTQWGLLVATLVSYSVLVFALVFRDKNCSLRKPQVRELIPQFLLVHSPFLLVVYWIEAEWLSQKSSMPYWLTVRGRKGSLYEWALTALLCLIAWRQQHWMRAIAKNRLTECRHEKLE
jgi:uncharacterized membrane protein (UPF0136 family)